MINRLMMLFSTTLLVIMLAACGSPEEKRMKFYDKGKALFEQGEYVKARLEFKNALQIDPKFADGYYMLGMVDQREGNLKGAYGAYLKAAELDPEHLKAQLGIGLLLALSRDGDRVIEQAELVLAKDPDNTEALTLKATGLLLKEDSAAAVALMEGLVARGVQDPDVYLTLGGAYARQKDSTNAEKSYMQGLEANPDSINLLLALTKIYYDGKRFKEAVGTMLQVIALAPENANYKSALAGIYWDAGWKETAVDQLNELTASDPANENNWMLVAGFYIGKKQYEQAEQTLKEGIEQNPNSFKIRNALGQVYVNLKKPYLAIDVFEGCLTLDDDPANPGIIQAKNSLAGVYLMLRQIEAAEKYVDEVLRDSPKNIEAHLNKGQIYLLDGDGVNAVSELRTVVNEKPGYMPAYISLANAHVLNKEVNLAVDTLQNALKVNPGSKDARRALARIYLLKKDNDAAEAQLRKIVEIDPADNSARADLGDFLLSVKDTRSAEEEYRLIKNANPQNALGYIKLYRFYISQGKPELALKTLEDGYRANPRSAALLVGLVQEYVRQKRHSDAIALCNARIEKISEDFVAYNLLGYVQGNLKNYREAETALEKAIEIQPLWPAPHNNLAGVYLAQGKKKEAVQKYESALKANPRDAVAYLALGLLYEKDREFEKAMQVYERALKADPNFWFAANNLAFLICERSEEKAELERALELSQKARRRRPGDPNILDTIGWVYYQMGDYPKAQGLIEQAVAAAPDSAILNYHLGMTLYRIGQTDEARKSLEKALEGDEDFYGRPEAEKLLKQLST